MAKEPKPISFPEGFFLILICLLADLFELLGGFLSASVILAPVGIFLGFMVDWIAWPIVQLALYFKNAKGFLYLAGSLIELIPLIDVLPIRTASILIVIYLANHPKTAALAGAKKPSSIISPAKRFNSSDS